jgi:hypothetical protein
MRCWLRHSGILFTFLAPVPPIVPNEPPAMFCVFKQLAVFFIYPLRQWGVADLRVLLTILFNKFPNLGLLAHKNFGFVKNKKPVLFRTGDKSPSRLNSMKISFQGGWVASLGYCSGLRLKCTMNIWIVQ